MGNMKVLIIDDNEDIVSFIETLIETILPGPEISCAYTGQEALDFLAKENFSIITLDGQLGDNYHGRDILAKMSPEQVRNTIVHSGDIVFLDQCKSKGINAISKNSRFIVEMKAILSAKGII